MLSHGRVLVMTIFKTRYLSCIQVKLGNVVMSYQDFKIFQKMKKQKLKK